MQKNLESSNLGQVPASNLPTTVQNGYLRSDDTCMQVTYCLKMIQIFQETKYQLTVRAIFIEIYPIYSDF